MDRTYKHLLIDTKDLPKEADDILSKMDVLCKECAEVENPKEIIDSLHSSFWQSLTTILVSYITEETKENFIIPKSLERWVNFGLISDVVCPDHEKVVCLDKEIPADKKDVYAEYKVFYLSDWLKKLYDHDLRLEKKQKLETDVKKAKKALEDYPASLERCMRRRDDFLSRFPEAKTVNEISHKIDTCLPEFSYIKDKIDHSKRVTTQERIRYVQLTEEITKLREWRAKEQQAISSKVPQHQMMRLDREIESIIMMKPDLQKRLDGAKKVLQDDLDWRDSITISNCREMLRESIRRVRTMSDLAARRSRGKPCSIMRHGGKIPSAVDIADAIENVLEIDPTLFTGTGGRHAKFPLILVVPAFGDGVFDFEFNVLMIPIFNSGGLLRSIATALIEFKLDSPVGNRFRESYLRLNKNKGVKSSMQVRDRLVKDYLDWVVKEANGYQVMDAETRKWFIETVAPSMFALKHPRRIGEFAAADAPTLIEEYDKRIEANPDDFDAHFRLGVVCWRIGNYAKASIAFRHAVELNSESADACYNAGMGAFKTGQKQKAINYWRKYLRVDKMSFWTTRVQKFLSTIR